MWLGPNAVLAFAREGYKLTDVNVKDLIDALGYRYVVNALFVCVFDFEIHTVEDGEKVTVVYYFMFSWTVGKTMPVYLARTY